MKEWLKISCLLCIFGFVREIRPSEPYVTEFLLGEWRNITKNELNREVYPFSTYAYLAQLVVVFLVTDFLRYKPLIITIGACGIIIWSLLIWTTSLFALQVVEFFYGTFMAAEVAYYTYIYAKVDKKYYPRVTAQTRAATFAGKLVAGISAQLLVKFHLMNLLQLNYITLGSEILATIWAFFLPKVKKSLYFHRKQTLTDFQSESSTVAANDDSLGVENNREDTKSSDSRNNGRLKTIGPFQLLYQHFRNAYTNPRVLQWSIWYAVGTCGYLMVYSYIQVLWREIAPLSIWNGAADAVMTISAALASLAAGYIQVKRLRSLTRLMVLAILSVVEGGVVLLSAWTDNIFVCYTGYILFMALYAFTITIVSAEVARYLKEDSFGLVFGINTLLGLVLQTILTVVIISNSVFALSAVGQYVVYGFYFIVTGLIYFVIVIVQYFLNKNSSDEVILIQE